MTLITWPLVYVRMGVCESVSVARRRGRAARRQPKMITVNKAFSNVVIKMIEESGDLIHLRAR